MDQAIVLWFCLMYGIITFIITILFLLIIPKQFPALFNEENWTVKKELVHISSTIFILALINSAVSYLIQTNYAIVHVSESIVVIKSFFFTIAIALIPTTIIVLWQQNKWLRYYQHEANEIETALESKKEKDADFIHIYGEGKNEEIQFNIDSLFYVKSSGNYCEFTFINNNNIERSLLRVNLKSVEEKLQNHDKIIKTHRSYLVNKNKVAHVTGNAQGLKLKLINIDDIVPVSRANTNYVKNVLT